MMVNSCYNSTDPDIDPDPDSDAGLALHVDYPYPAQKCYMADTGLLVTMTFMEGSYLDNALYKAILFDRIDINEGMLMENIVAQTLRCNHHKLYYYSRSDSVMRANHLKIDFLITRDRKISPVEVKSTNYRSHASLDKFAAKFPKMLGPSYILYPGDVMEKDGIWHLPIYMAMFL